MDCLAVYLSCRAPGPYPAISRFTSVSVGVHNESFFNELFAGRDRKLWVTWWCLQREKAIVCAGTATAGPQPDN